MPGDREALRDWHRLFGLVLLDFFSGSPFTVEVERDLSEQQQLLDVVIVRRGQGDFEGKLPDGLEPLAEHNLFTFKSHREALDDWAMRELNAHFVAYRKLVSPSPGDLLGLECFRLYAVAARFPHNLAHQIPWQQRQAGVYDCTWGVDTVRVIVAGQLPRAAHNAPLHLFSAAPELVSFGQGAYRQRAEETSLLLRQLLERFREEGLLMSYTMEDFKRDYVKEHFPKLTPGEQREVWQSLPPRERQELLASLPPEERRELLASLPPGERRELLASLPLEDRLAGLSEEQIRQFLDQLAASQTAPTRKPRRGRPRKQTD
jgi:hypothetical protein